MLRKYSDTPMDFADATLLLLAEVQQVEEILTMDRRGFTVFRTTRANDFGSWAKHNLSRFRQSCVS